MFDTIPNLKSGIEVFLEKNEFMLNSTDYLIRRLLRFLTTVKK